VSPLAVVGFADSGRRERLFLFAVALARLQSPVVLLLTFFFPVWSGGGGRCGVGEGGSEHSDYCLPGCLPSLLIPRQETIPEHAVRLFTIVLHANRAQVIMRALLLPPCQAAGRVTTRVPVSPLQPSRREGRPTGAAPLAPPHCCQRRSSR